jgi:hypothetical protein
MVMMKRLLSIVLLILLCLSNVHSQEEDTIGLKKFYWNITPFIGLESYSTSSLTPTVDIGSGGILYKMGNNWQIRKRKRTTFFFKLIWMRIGIYPQGLISTPLNVGGGLHYDFNKKNSFETSLTGGLVVATDDALNPALEFNYLISPEAKINLGNFSIGIEYSIRTFRSPTGTPQSRWHYIGLEIGGRFGRIKK